MRPDERELDAEIRCHLALSARERIERGEDPETARLAALREFGYIPAVRDSMRRVWHSRWLDGVAALGQDMRVGLRSLLRAKGLAVTVVVALALGIGANAAVFSVVRAVLLRPLVNRDEARLVYIRQGAPGLGAENTTFSVPEIEDFKARATTISAFGDFSTVDFTLIGLGGEPRVVKAGVVGGSYFEVMGLRPVLGRLLDAADDGPDAAGAVVLTHRFWTTSLDGDPAVLGKIISLGPRTAEVVGVLEPSVPYPADTEIIANVVTSPHHLEAVMVTGRTHRMTELFGRLAPGASLDAARADLIAAHDAMVREHPEAYSPQAGIRLSVTPLRDQIAAPARTMLLVLLAAAGIVFVIACSNVANLILARSVRREGELAVRSALGASHGALRRTLLAESLMLCGAGAVLGVVLARPLAALVARYAARFSVRALEVTVDTSVLWVGAGLAMAAAVLLAYAPPLPASAWRAAAPGSLRPPPADSACSRRPRLRARSCCSPARARSWPRSSPCRRRPPATTCGRCWRSTSRRRRRESEARRSSTSIGKRRGASARCRASRASRWGASCRGATPVLCFPDFRSPSKEPQMPMAKGTRRDGSGSWLRVSSPSSAFRCSPAATSRTRTAPAASGSSS
jgi:hypothetical protein